MKKKLVNKITSNTWYNTKNIFNEMLSFKTMYITTGGFPWLFGPKKYKEKYQI